MKIHVTAVAMLAVGLGCEAPAGAFTDSIIVTGLDTLITQESELLAGPNELTVLGDGRLLLTDARANQLLLLDHDGRVQQVLGRSGSGPSEFQSPRSSSVVGDTVRVIDGGNGRVQTLTIDGHFVSSASLPPATMSGRVVFLPTGAYVVSRNGRDSTLAQRFTEAGEPGVSFGTPVAPVPEVWHFPTVKAAISEGVVPNELRNMTMPLVALDGSVWLVLTAEGIVQRYDVHDAVRWSVPLTEPEFEVLKADFFVRNQEEGDPTRLYPLAYIADGQVIGDELWLLLWPAANAGAKFVVVGPSGDIVRRVSVPAVHGVRVFAIDRERELLYLVSSDDAMLLRASFPSGSINGS